MSGIFISYRRDDTGGWAGRLAADLGRRLPEDRVFHDVAAIGAGDDFIAAIERALASCAVVLVMIGPNWLAARDREGERRLLQPDDPVRLEIRLALGRPELRVVPVLVGGVRMPAAEELPDDLAALATRHAMELSDARWDYDLDRLVKQLARIPGVVPRARNRPLAIAMLGVAMLATAAVAWFASRSGEEAATGPRSPVAVAQPAEPVPPSVPPAIQAPAAAPKSEPAPDEPPARAASKPAPTVQTPARIEIDGVWATDIVEDRSRGIRSREMFELEARRGALFGTNWVETWRTPTATPGIFRKFALVDGKVEQDRLTFCIQPSAEVRKGDRWESVPFRECYDGVVAGSEIRFIATNNIGHPSLAPETRTFTARRRTN